MVNFTKITVILIFSTGKAHAVIYCFYFLIHIFLLVCSLFQKFEMILLHVW